MSQQTQYTYFLFNERNHSIICTCVETLHCHLRSQIACLDDLATRASSKHFLRKDHILGVDSQRRLHLDGNWTGEEMEASESIGVLGCGSQRKLAIGKCAYIHVRLQHNIAALEQKVSKHERQASTNLLLLVVLPRISAQ